MPDPIPGDELMILAQKLREEAWTLICDAQAYEVQAITLWAKQEQKQ